MSAELPERPNLEHLKSQAKALLRAFRQGDASVVEQFRSLSLKPGAAPKLADAQRLIAQKYGFASWARLKAHVAATPAPDPIELAKAAMHSDDAPALRELIQRYPKIKALVNEPIGPFDSPPIISVKSRQMLDVLLDAGADINGRSRWWAGSFGILDSADPPLAAYAIERGATLTAHAAARLGMFDELRKLIAADPSLVHARGGDGQMPLHFASTVEIAEYLLDNGADIDARDIDHESTAAQWMLRERQDVARFLVSRGCWNDILMAAALGDLERVRQHLGADPASIRTSVTAICFPMKNPRAGGSIYIWTLGQNKTPHQVAREFGHEEVFQLLMEHTPVEMKLALAGATGDEATLKSLLASRPDLIETMSEDDRRKLVDAAQNNQTSAVHTMLEAGWPINARGQHRGTALHWASWHGNAEMARELLLHKPPLNDADNDFHATPLGWATHGSEHGWHRRTGDYPGTVELLCAAGAILPKAVSGTEPVKEVLRRYGVTGAG